MQLQRGTVMQCTEPTISVHRLLYSTRYVIVGMEYTVERMLGKKSIVYRKRGRGLPGPIVLQKSAAKTFIEKKSSFEKNILCVVLRRQNMPTSYKWSRNSRGR